MNWRLKLQRRLRALFQKPTLDAEMNEEMRSHIEMQTQENIGAGMNAEEARYAALRQFGWVESIKATCREQRGVTSIEQLAQDVRYGSRMLLKNPGFTAVAVLTLALGIGATTAIVSVVKTAVFDPLPVRHPERFLQLGVVHKERGWSPGVNPPALRDALSQTNLFARVAAYYPFDLLTLQGEEFPQPVPGVWVTSEFFGFWNLRPLLGRTFTADDGQPGKDDVLLISHRLWQRQFGGDPAIIGRTVPFRERPMTVVGVMPPHFSFPTAEKEYWRPVQGPDPGTDEILPNTRVIAEVRPGVEIAQVQAFLEVLSKRQAQEFWEGKVILAFQTREVREMFSKPEVRRTLGLLLGAIAFVLFIAAANIANLQLARTETRQQELAVRAALGAGRARVFRQLLTESLLLAVLGGAAGLAVTALGLDLLPKLIPADLPRLKPIVLNAGVLGIACVVTLVTALLFGLTPAWQGGRSNLSEVLKLGAATSTRDQGRGWFSRTLIVGQVALALVLLAGAGLMVRSVIGLLRVNPNLDPQSIVRIYPPVLDLFNRVHSQGGRDKVVAAKFAFFADAQQRIAAVPGVIATGVAFEGPEMEVSTTPGSMGIRLMKDWIGIEQADPLRVLLVPLKQGRWLDRSDVGEGVRRVVVNEMAARQLWPGEEAVGKRFWEKKRDAGLAHEVVGVVGDTRDYRDQVAPKPRFWQTLREEPNIELTAAFLVVRAAVDPATLYKPIGQALKAAGADPRMPLFINLQEALRAGMAGHRAVMLYLCIFAGVGLFLAAIGLYGVLAYSVARRTREIGIRMALGAQIADVIRLILGQGLVLVAVGGVIGITIALATGRVLRAYLFGVSSTDPVTFIAVGLLLAAVALFACWLPARRASKVDPMEALRYE
jgi:putative ABC transport system permease protein